MIAIWFWFIYTQLIKILCFRRYLMSSGFLSFFIGHFIKTGKLYFASIWNLNARWFIFVKKNPSNLCICIAEWLHVSILLSLWLCLQILSEVGNWGSCLQVQHFFSKLYNYLIISQKLTCFLVIKHFIQILLNLNVNILICLWYILYFWK